MMTLCRWCHSSGTYIEKVTTAGVIHWKCGSCGGRFKTKDRQMAKTKREKKKKIRKQREHATGKKILAKRKKPAKTAGSKRVSTRIHEVLKKQESAPVEHEPAAQGDGDARGADVTDQDNLDPDYIEDDNDFDEARMDADKG